MRARALLLAFASAMGACAFHVPEGRLACMQASECPSGWSCVGGHCYASAPEDAGGLDGDLDAGRDGGLDASAFDAGPDGGHDARVELDAFTTVDSAIDAIDCDRDHDGHDGPQCGGPDCNDTDPAIHPGAAEACDGVDSDCDSMADAVDGDARGTCFLRECLGDHCERATDVACGDFTCALLTTPRIACWGNGTNGEFTGAATSATSPIVIRTLDAVGVELSVGYNSLCYRDATGIVRCAGGGPTGDGMAATSIDAHADPIVGVTGVTQHSVSGPLGIALTSTGAVYQWGLIAQPPMTSPFTSDAPMILTASFPAAVTQVEAGWHMACALLADHSVRCWGDLAQGLGFSGAPTNAFDEPTGLSDAVELSVGRFYFACARRVAGDIVCWGDPPAGDYAPAGVPVIHDALQVRAGGSHVCALRSDHSVWCWGDDTHGQLGRGTISVTPSATPAMVTGLPSIARIGQAFDHTCAIDMDGFVWCWGANAQGQVTGDGVTLSDVASATRVVLP